MRLLRLAAPASFLFLVTACTSGTPASTSSAPADGGSSTPATSSSPSPSSSAPSGDQGGAATGAVLTGELGQNNAFTISLKDASGAEVTTLKAGTYQVKVDDTSAIHNFHLSGPGVEQKTTVPEITKITWPVTLKAGTYTYQCDPHPNMKHTFTVS